MRRRRKRSRVLRSEANDASSAHNSPAPVDEKNVHTETDKKSLAVGSLVPSREDDESTVEGYDTENYRQFQSANLIDLSNENDFASSFKQAPHSPVVEASIETRVQNDEMDGLKEKKEEKKEVRVRKRGRPPKMKIRDALVPEHPVVGVPGRQAVPKENLHKKQQCLSSPSSSVLPSNLVVEPTSSLISFSDIVTWNSNANTTELHMQIDNNNRHHHHHPTYQTDTAGGNLSSNHSSLQNHRHAHTLVDNFSALGTKQMGAGDSTPASKNDKENKRNDDNSGNVIAVVCGSNHGLMHLSRLSLATGERCKTKCIQFNDRWWTPSEFQMTSGRGAAKDWKRTIRHGDKCLKALLESGTLKLNLCNKNACFCDTCNSTSYHSLVNLSKLPSQSSGTTSDLTSEEVFNKSPPRNVSRPAVGEVVSGEDGRKEGRKRSKETRRDRSPMQKKMRVSDGRRTDQKAVDLVHRRNDTSGDSHVTDFIHAHVGMKSSDEENRRSEEALLRRSMFQVPLSPVEFFCQQQQLMQSHLNKSSEYHPSNFYAEAFSSLAGFNGQSFMGSSLHHPGFGSPNLSGFDFQQASQLMENKSYFHGPTSVCRQDSTNSFPSLSQAESPSASMPMPAESRTHLRAVIEELKLKKKKSLSHVSSSSLNDQMSNGQKSSASSGFDHQSPPKEGQNEESSRQDSAVDLSKTLNNTNELVKLLTGSNCSLKSSLNSRPSSPSKSTTNGFASHGFFNPLFSPPLSNHSLNLPFSHAALPFYSPYIFMGFPLHPLIPSTSLGNLSPSAHHQNTFLSQFAAEQTTSSKTAKTGFNLVNFPQNGSPENITKKHSCSKTYFPSKYFPYNFPADVKQDCDKTSDKLNLVTRSSEGKEKLKEILLKAEDDEEGDEDKKCITRSEERAHLEGVDSSTVLDFSLKNPQISKGEQRECRDGVNNENLDDDRDRIPDNDNGQVLDLSKK